jgi:hypothetical protein
LTIAKAIVYKRIGVAVSSANRIFLFYQPPADILFIDGQTVCSNSHAAIAVLHGSIDKSVGQYDPRFVNLLGLYSWYLYLEIFLYIVTGGI